MEDCSDVVAGIGYLLSYKDNLKKLNDKVEKLNDIKDQVFKPNTKHARLMEYNVEGWRERFDEISEASKPLRAEYESLANARCYPWRAPNLMSRYKRGQEAMRLMEILEELGELVPSHADLDYASEKLESRNSMMEEIVEALKQPSATKIGLYGIAGVGKTHLASQVDKQVRGKLFDSVVNVPKSLSVEGIQDEIENQLKHGLEGTRTDMSRASRICERIKKEKSVLIILDDMWEKIDLANVGIPPPDNDYKGCKLFLISRNRHVLEKNETEQNFKLDPLNDEESRSFFLIKTSEDGVIQEGANLRNMAKEVASRCEGLPLAIATMAQFYKEKGKKEESMELNDSDYEKMIKEKIYSSVETSYKKLEDGVNKVFLLCGALGTPISTSDLLKYVIGLGVFGHDNEESIDDTRNKLKRAIDDLKAFSLLLEDHNAREVKMNTLICKVTPLIASKNLSDYPVFTRIASSIKTWPEYDVYGRCKQIILKCCHIQELPTRLDCPNLNFLYLDTIADISPLQFPESFFKGTENLLVLVLIGMNIPSLPASLDCLAKLKTLCLHQCYLKNMVGIGTLKSLEILSFFQSSINEFLDEIGQLTHLRMLDLRFSTIELIQPNIVSKLPQLEELYAREGQNLSKQNMKEILDGLEHLRSLTALELHILHGDWVLPSDKIFEKLQRFNIVIGDGWDWSDSNGTSRLLKLHTSFFLQGMNNLINNVEDLYLDEINGISNVVCELNDEGVAQIRKLHIQNNTKIEHVVKSRKRNQTPAAWFPNLETMILVNLKNLKGIYDGPLTIPSFAKLKVIKVRGCGQLEYLFPVSIIKQASQLAEIEVRECLSMKTIVSLDNGPRNDPIEFSSLDSLTLQNLQGINCFCSHADHEAVNRTLFSNPKDHLSLPCLKHLKLINISLIMHLATSTISDDNAVVPLQNLETLQIDGCNELHWLFNIKGYKMHQSYGGLFPMMRQLFLLNLSGFKRVVSLKIPDKIFNFQRLNHLTFCGCNQLKYFLPLYIVKNLQQLQTIAVSDCDNLQQLFGDEKDKQMKEPNETILPLLRSLKLINLPVLVRICSGDIHIIYRSFIEMTVENCPKFTFSFSSYLTRTKEKDPSEQSSLEIISPHLLENLKLKGLNHLKNLSRDRLVSFNHLTSLQLYECNKLEYLFLVGVARELSSLQELKITSCNNVEQILSREMERKASAHAITIFPEVTTLVLNNLPRLVGFCHGCNIRWLSLKTVKVVECAKIKKSKLGIVDRPLLKSVEVSRCQPWETEDQETNIFYLFHLTEETSKIVHLNIRNSHQLKKYLNMDLVESSFRQLRSLKAIQCDTELSKLVSILLRLSYKLEQLTVENCEELEQIFDFEEFSVGDRSNWRFPNLKTIRLFGLPKLNCIWDKGPRGFIELRNMVKLEIIKCGLHKSPISPVVLEELVSLEELKIESCQMVKHVVEDDEGMQNRVLSNLKILQLVNLQELIKFNSGHCNFRFPNMLHLTIQNCPKMNAFTAGFLSQQSNEGSSDHVPQNEMMDTCPELSKLKLVKIETLKELWQDWASARMPVNVLKDIEVDSLSSVTHIFPPNLVPRLGSLEKLVVRNCSSLHYVFGKGERESSMAFQMLQIVRVHNCPSLQRLSIPSCCRLLREIEISNCNDFQKIFLDKEETNAADSNFFPYLHSIVLENLPELSCFSSKTFQFPCLQKLRIVNCPAMKAFKSAQKYSFRHKFMDMNSLAGNKLALEWKGLDNKYLWKQKPESSVWKNLTSLKIVRCRNIKTLFHLSVAKKLEVLKLLKLQECDSMVQVLHEEGTIRILLNLESLVLKRMPNLTSFCEEADVDFELPKLKMVRVENIPKMQTFVKGPLKAKNLNQVYATYITKCWQEDLNQTIKYLNENHDKFVANVWVTSKKTP